MRRLVVATGLLLTVLAGAAEADCLQSGTTVTCSGASPGGFDAGVQDGLTVNVLPGATVGSGLMLNSGNSVSNSGAIAVGDFGSGLLGSINNQVTSSGTIQGGDGAVGIFVDSGSSVTHSGTMTMGNGAEGIIVTGTGSILNTGTLRGGDSSVGLTALNVTNAASGTIVMGDGGIGIDGEGNGGRLVNSGSITVGEGAFGILSTDSAVTVINNGTIAFGSCATGVLATGTGSAVTNNGTIAGRGCAFGVGIETGDGSTVTNNGVISVDAMSAGVFAGRSSAIANAGRIVTGQEAVGLYANSDSVLRNSGTIVVQNGFIAGAGMLGDGNRMTLVNTGTIIGGAALPAMIVTGRDSTLTNSGTISVGTFGGGMVGQGRRNVFVNAGSIAVGREGLGIDAQGADSSITNSGTITGGAASFGIQARSSSAVLNTGSIAVGTGGIGISGNAATTVGNSGSVVAGENGVGIRSGGNITNSGTIVVGSSGTFGTGGMLAVGDSLILTNTGTIGGGTFTPAIFALGTGVTLANSGTITVGTSGGGLVLRGVNGHLTNGGTINVGNGGIGIDAQGISTTALNSGAINAGSGGIGIQAVGSSVVGNSGSISVGAGGTGISGAGSTIIGSSGSISVGSGGTGIAALGSNVAVTNSGAISTCGTGISVAGAGARLVNSGSISANGCGATGVLLGPGSTLANSGLISASTVLAMGSGGGASVTNTGTLNGLVLLSGTGGNTLVNGGTIGTTATLAPGGALAHVVDGTFTQTSAAVLGIRASTSTAPGTYDTLQVASSVPGTGVANLAGTVQLALQPGLYALDTTYAGVLTFSSSTGRFTLVSEPYTFLSASAVYNPTSVDIVVSRIPFPQIPGGGANAQAVANVLEANYSPSLTGPLGAFYMDLLLSTAPNTLSQLTGEVATAPQSASFTVFGQFLDTIFQQTGRSRAPGGSAATGSAHLAVAAAAPCNGDACQGESFAPRYNAWAQGFGGSGSIDGSASAGSSRIDMNAGGAALGMDLAVAPGALLGFTLGTTSAGYNLTDLLSSGGARSIVAGVYGGYSVGPAYVDAALAYAYNTFTSSRFIGTGALSEIASASFAGSQYGGRVEGGWRFDLADVQVTPFAGLTAQALSQSAYTESSRTAGTGAPGLLAVSVQAQTTTSIRSVLGARIEAAITAVDDAVLRPHLRLGWAHEFNTSRTATVSLGTVLPGAPFQVIGAEPAPNALVVGAGFDLELSRSFRLYGQFDGEFSSNASALAGTGGLRIVW